MPRKMNQSSIWWNTLLLVTKGPGPLGPINKALHDYFSYTCVITFQLKLLQAIKHNIHKHIMFHIK